MNRQQTLIRTGFGMRCINKLIAAVILVLTMASPLKAEIQVLTRDSEELQQFIRLMQHNLAAWSFHKDDAVFDEAAPDYTHRPDAVFWDTAPPLQGFRGWSEYRKAAENWSKHGIDQADISVVDLQQFKGWRYQDLVWNIMHCGISLKFASGENAEHRCRGTVIWEWEGDRWRLAHEVFSAPVEPGQTVFQANRPQDPRIEPYLDLMQRAKQLASAWGNATTEGLADRLAGFYVKNNNLTVFTPWKPFEVYQGWTAYRQGLEKYVATPFTRVKITLNDDLEAQRRGKIAWSTATLHIETESRNGTLIPGDARQTLIWYLTDDGWRILHEHFSFPQ